MTEDLRDHLNRYVHGCHLRASGVPEILQDLSKYFEVKTIGQEVILDHTFRILIQPSFLHCTQWKNHWKVFRSEGEHHAVVTFGLCPDGSFTKEDLVISKVLIDSRKRGLLIKFEEGLRWIHEDLKRMMHGANGGAESTFREAALKMTVMNLAEISRTLGWPHNASRRMYWRLVNRGEHLPPIQKKAGRIVENVCMGCGRSQWECPSRAVVLRSNLCLSCTRRRPSKKVRITCPSCGRVDYRWPSAIRHLSNGVNTVCRKCQLVTKGENATRRFRRAAGTERNQR